jgi:hypothetical protein
VPTYAENLILIRDQLAAEFAGETARRAALVAAGLPPPTTYSIDGQMVDWNGYIRAMREEMAALSDEIAENAEIPYEINNRGFT